jgi:hypothetical protein
MSNYSSPDIHDDQGDQTTYAYIGEKKIQDSHSKALVVKRSVKNLSYQKFYLYLLLLLFALRRPLYLGLIPMMSQKKR